MVETGLTAAGDRDGGEASAAFFLPRLQFTLYSRSDSMVDARPSHIKIGFVLVVISAMKSDFGGRECKDQPTVTGVYGRGISEHRGRRRDRFLRLCCK